jgi:hypothetical protein
MNDTEELERRATERLAWKAEGVDAILAPAVSRGEEIESARSALDSSLPLLIDREISRRDRAFLDAAEVVANDMKSGADIDDGLDDDRSKRFNRYISRAETHDGRVTRLENIAAEKRAVLKVAVTSEPRTYGPGSRQSYYIDLARAAVPGPLHREAVERLDRHALEVSHQAGAGTAEGQRAIRTAVTRSRTGTAERDVVQAEVRAMTSGSSSGGAFVTPQYLVSDWATYRTYAPSFLEQTTKVPDAGYGLQMNVPAISSIATVGQQTENSGVSDSSPTAGYLTSPLVTFAGEVDVSQLLFDQSSPLGIDEVLYAQLQQDLLTQLDAYALTQAMAGAGTVTGGTWSIAAFWGDLAKASSQMLTSAGTVLAPTHLFMPPTFYEWATAQVDNQNRPILVPQPSGTVLPIATAPDGQPPVGYTGERILTSSVFTDGNIATSSGGYAQFVLANAANVFTLTTEPTCRAIPETLANELTVVIQVYAQFGIVVRHAAGVQVVSGAAYPSSPTFS